MNAYVVEGHLGTNCDLRGFSCVPLRAPGLLKTSGLCVRREDGTHAKTTCHQPRLPTAQSPHRAVPVVFALLFYGVFR